MGLWGTFNQIIAGSWLGTLYSKPGILAHASSPIVREAEAGDLPLLAWITERDPVSKSGGRSYSPTRAFNRNLI